MPDPSEYMSLIDAQAQANRINTNTPFGSISYNTVYDTPLGFDDWMATNPDIPTKPGGRWIGGSRGPNSSGYWSDPIPQPQDAYQNYVDNFDRGVGTTTASFEFSPEGQSLFDKQFDPNAYDNYSQDYMDRYSQLIEPDRKYLMDRFEQNMFDRGQPVGGEEYGDKYRQTIGDPFARQDVMAAQQAAATADMARLQDYNRLASALGLSTINAPHVDVMGPANMALNANMQNAQLANQQSSNIWNALAALGGGMAMGGTGLFAPGFWGS